MDNQNLAEKLRERRQQLGLCQDYMSAKLGITQPAYSGIENDKTRFTPKLLEQIKSLVGFEDFDQPAPVQTPGSGVKQTLASRWKWGRPLLHVVVILLAVLCADPIFQIGIELYRGFALAEPDVEITAAIAMFYILIYTVAIYWLVYRKKW